MRRIFVRAFRWRLPPHELFGCLFVAGLFSRKAPAASDPLAAKAALSSADEKAELDEYVEQSGGGAAWDADLVLGFPARIGNLAVVDAVVPLPHSEEQLQGVAG
jgi:hypothetical protein